MKTYELKGRLIGKAHTLIDMYFDGKGIVDILANSTMKAYLATNEHAIDGMIKAFAGNGDDIDIEKIKDIYVSNMPDDGVYIDVRDFIRNDYVSSLMPDRCLHITKKDIEEIMSENNSGD